MNGGCAMIMTMTQFLALLAVAGLGILAMALLIALSQKSTEVNELKEFIEENWE
jgi:hypothetical protein